MSTPEPGTSAAPSHATSFDTALWPWRPARRRPFQFGLKSLLIAMAICCAVLGVRGMLVRRDMHAREKKSKNNLQHIAVAFKLPNYVAYYPNRGLPPRATIDVAGKPQLSWRVLILSGIGHYDLATEFHMNEPWDSPHNLTLIPRMPSIYASPITRAGVHVPPGMTCYLAVAGENTLFPTPPPPRAPPPPYEFLNRSRILWPAGVKFSDVPDGLSNTIMVVEAAPERAVIWTKPDDFEVNEKLPTAGLVGHRWYEFFALFGDGSVRRIPEGITSENARRLFLRNDGLPVDMMDLEGAPK